MHELPSSTTPYLEKNIKELRSGRFFFAVGIDPDPRNYDDVEASKIVVLHNSTISSVCTVDRYDDFFLDITDVLRGSDPFTLLEKGVRKIVNGYEVRQDQVKTALALVEKEGLQTVCSASRFTHPDGKIRIALAVPITLREEMSRDEACVVSAHLVLMSAEQPAFKAFKRELASANK